MKDWANIIKVAVIGAIAPWVALLSEVISQRVYMKVSQCSGLGCLGTLIPSIITGIGVGIAFSWISLYLLKLRNSLWMTLAAGASLLATYPFYGKDILYGRPLLYMINGLFITFTGIIFLLCFYGIFTKSRLPKIITLLFVVPIIGILLWGSTVLYQVKSDQVELYYSKGVE